MLEVYNVVPLKRAKNGGVVASEVGTHITNKVVCGSVPEVIVPTPLPLKLATVVC